MKKLMIAAMAMAAGAAFADTEIASANVVGYQNKEIGKFNLTAQTFVKCNASEDVTFGDIKPNDNFISGGTIQLFTSEGKAGDVLVYVNDPDLLEAFEAEEGWYLFTDEELTDPKNETVIGYANGFVSKAPLVGSELTYAGAVKTGETEIPVGKFTLTGNCLPENLTLADITPNENFISGGTIQFFTNQGKAADVLVYVNDPDLLEAFEAEEGWYLFTDEELTDPKNGTAVNAGDVFVAKAPLAGSTLTLKAIVQ